MEYLNASCVIVPSRDEPTSMIWIEAMMFSRSAIVSDKTGASEVITNGEQGLVFHNEDVDELVKCIQYAIDNPDEILQMGIKARKLYEEQYALPFFEKSFSEIVDQLTTER